MYSVALVGRPNVGKSTLFNRLTEERDAITSAVSGTTRDRRYGEVLWNGRRFRLIDTGGYLATDEDAFTAGIRVQIAAACKEATHILLVVDAQVGILHADESMADYVRRLGTSVWVVVNKADDSQDALAAGTFHALGFGAHLYAVSAANGTGTGELLDALSAEVARTPNGTTQPPWPRISIIGRPNVGKSSLLNALLGHGRSLVSEVAGTTRDALDTPMQYHKKRMIWVDTAGIRKKAKQEHAIEFYSVLRALRAMESSAVCVVVIAADEGLCAQDLHVLREAHNKKRGLVLAINKWDLVDRKTGTYESYRALLQKRLGDLAYVPMVFTSAHTKVRLSDLVAQALAVHAARQTRISTAKLNRIMAAEVMKHPPPSQKGRIMRIKYFTQVKTAAPLFVAFCNRPPQIPVHYTRFLIGRLRDHFGFVGTPIGLRYRSGDEKRN